MSLLKSYCQTRSKFTNIKYCSNIIFSFVCWNLLVN